MGHTVWFWQATTGVYPDLGSHHTPMVLLGKRIGVSCFEHLVFIVICCSGSVKPASQAIKNSRILKDAPHVCFTDIHVLGGLLLRTASVRPQPFNVSSSQRIEWICVYHRISQPSKPSVMHPPTYSPAHLLTQLLAHHVAFSISHLIAHTLGHTLGHTLTHATTHSLSHSLTCSLHSSLS